MTVTKIGLGIPFTIGEWEMVVVESRLCAATAIADCLVATATREPIAIIVRGPDGERTLDLKGQEVP